MLALPLGALLVWRERRARQPVVPPRLFRDRRFTPLQRPGLHFLLFSAIMAVGLRTAGGLALRIGSRAMLAVGSLVTGSGYALFALSASRPEDSLGFLPGFVLTGIGITARVATLTTVVLTPHRATWVARRPW